jgi:hypothetical protein
MMTAHNGAALMDEIDALLDALWAAGLDGDTEAAIFLQMFAPWVISHAA